MYSIPHHEKVTAHGGKKVMKVTKSVNVLRFVKMSVNVLEGRVEQDGHVKQKMQQDGGVKKTNESTFE